MPQRGRKPQPTNLRLLQGLDRRNDAEPIPPSAGKPAPPWYLSDLALEEWERISDDLYGMGVLTGIDCTMLAAYCTAYAAWRKAESDLRGSQQLALDDENDKTYGGALMETTNGNLVQSPLVGIVNVARREMARLATEFGLTPSSRTLIDATKRGETDPVSARYFGRGR